MKTLPPDVETLMEELPQEVIDEIQLKLVVFSSLDAMRMGPKQPTPTELFAMLDRTGHEQVRLLRLAKDELDRANE